MNAWTQPSANNRLDPIADAFALQFEPTALRPRHHQITHGPPFTHEYFVVIRFLLIAFKGYTTHRVAAQIHITF